jgi:hypothetical protein
MQSRFQMRNHFALDGKRGLQQRHCSPQPMGQYTLRCTYIGLRSNMAQTASTSGISNAYIVEFGNLCYALTDYNAIGTMIRTTRRCPADEQRSLR